MSRTLILVLFAMMCLAQLVAPASMIYQREATLAHGETFKFRTAPVDPYDAFRGRYVALGYEQGTVSGDWSDDGFRRGRVVYATLERDAEGFAQVTAVSRNRPDAPHYLKARIRWASRDQLTLDLPFDRYYMGEFDAPAAEREFLWRQGRQERRAYAVTRVRRGFGVIEELMVEDQPIREWLLSQDAKQ